MRKVATTIRCVPRFGYDYTQTRTIDVDVLDPHDDSELRDVVARWFAQRGIADAVFDVDVDDDGFFAIINDESYEANWGDPLI